MKKTNKMGSATGNVLDACSPVDMHEIVFVCACVSEYRRQIDDLYPEHGTSILSLYNLIKNRCRLWKCTESLLFITLSYNLLLSQLSVMRQSASAVNHLCHAIDGFAFFFIIREFHQKTE